MPLRSSGTVDGPALYELGNTEALVCSALVKNLETSESPATTFTAGLSLTIELPINVLPLDGFPPHRVAPGWLPLYDLSTGRFPATKIPT